MLNETPRIEVLDIPTLPVPRQSADRWPDVTLEEAERRPLLCPMSRWAGNKAAASRLQGVTSRTVANMLRHNGDAV